MYDDSRIPAIRFQFASGGAATFEVLDVKDLRGQIPGLLEVLEGEQEEYLSLTICLMLQSTLPSLIRFW